MTYDGEAKALEVAVILLPLWIVDVSVARLGGGSLQRLSASASEALVDRAVDATVLRDWTDLMAREMTGS